MFYKKLAKIINANQSKSIVLSGNVYDLFNVNETGKAEFVPLMDYLTKKCQVAPDKTNKGKTVLVYEINRSLQVHGDYEELENAWNTWKKIPNYNDGIRVPGTTRTGWADHKDSFASLRSQTTSESTLCIEFLRQLTLCSQQCNLKNDLVIIIEGAHLLLPVGNISSLNFADRRRIGIFFDWFSDPAFINGHNSVILVAESKSLINPMVSGLPMIASVEVPAPSTEDRRIFAQSLVDQKLATEVKHVEMTAGLSLYAYRQILLSEDNESVIEKVQEYISAQLGDDVVEFKNPIHHLNDVVGYSQLKKFLKEDLMVAVQATDDSAIIGAAVAGPIGAGKSYIFEAFASELGMIVLVLKNLRSQWFGQTDVIFERLRRVLMALDKVCIFVDEADTQFGGVGPDTHETERRLTGKIQNMMSDPALKGKVFWLLMTARINLLSPDIRRPGRAGDLIIPVLDPSASDREEFLDWILKACKITEVTAEDRAKFLKATSGYSSASYSSLRARVKSKKCKTMDDIMAIIDDLIMPDHLEVRTYQTLQALLNCTRKSLIPADSLTDYANIEIARKEWQAQLRNLEPKIHY